MEDKNIKQNIKNKENVLINLHYLHLDCLDQVFFNVI